jgi:hypothetical protein
MKENFTCGQNIRSMIIYSDQVIFRRYVFYQFSALFEKIPLTFDRLKQLNEDGLPILREGEMYFEEGHPGRRYWVLKE